MFEEREQARANRELDGDAKDMLAEIESQRHTANQLEKLVQELRKKLKDESDRYEDQLDELTEKIEEISEGYPECCLWKDHAEAFLKEKGFLEEYYRFSASKIG